MWKIQVQSLGWEDPLEKGMGTHSIPGEFHGQRSLVGYNARGHCQKRLSDWHTQGMKNIWKKNINMLRTFVHWPTFQLEKNMKY